MTPAFQVPDTDPGPTAAAGVQLAADAVAQTTRPACAARVASPDAREKTIDNAGTCVLVVLVVLVRVMLEVSVSEMLPAVVTSSLPSVVVGMAVDVMASVADPAVEEAVACAVQ